MVKCPCGVGVDLGEGSLEARRYCGGTFTGGARWDKGSIANCNFSNQAREICNLASVGISRVTFDTGLYYDIFIFLASVFGKDIKAWQYNRNGALFN